ncbi:cytoplasmic protein [Heyndrickxia shackletonii]|uniref:Cytoplasmic protein n=1 Tax=Heyndrickxia shackletonii TaxID=157838 RepID=A0A0Q3TNI8_9BACI|nr:DUF1697 domain-containing protein [Heyndrickxia shackletonii]KQL55337.1 cytoplasmic protein [Heyndrickxia shackletonii]NEZ01915.1 DUF1697 domain-containing protein [Heyndrickxia shackletonii]
MTIYIALFRGINVGGHNIIKMAELRNLFQTIQLKNVKTYIQSGNVVFESEEEEKTLRNRLEQEVEKTFGFPVSIILRTSIQIEKIIQQCPFPVDHLLEGESVHVAFLEEEPTQEAVDRLRQFENDDEQFRLIGKEMYLFFRKSIRDSKLAVQVQRVGVQATVRNWRTTVKLDSMAKEMKNE